MLLKLHPLLCIESFLVATKDTSGFTPLRPPSHCCDAAPCGNLITVALVQNISASAYMCPIQTGRTKVSLSSHAWLLPSMHSLGVCYTTRDHRAIEAGESPYCTCSSGRDKSSIQACSKSGEVLCGGSGAVSRGAWDKAGCSDAIMTWPMLAAGATVVSRQAEVVYISTQ